MSRISSATAWATAGTIAVVASVSILAASISVAIARDEQPAPDPVPALAANAPKKIVVFGDSLTAGSVEGGVGQNGWSEKAWHQLRADGFDILPEVSGRGGSGYAKRGPDGTTILEEAARMVTPSDDVIVFFGGSNDFGEENSTEAIQETLRAARATAPHAKMIVVGPIWPVKAVPTPETQFAFDNLLGIRDDLRAEAARIGATFVDPIADRWFMDQPDLIGYDEIHPTDAGHDYMYQKLLPVLRSALTS